MRLVDLHPSLGGDELLARFVPPRRFADVRFDTFIPDPDHPAQAEALARMAALDTRSRGAAAAASSAAGGPSTPASPGLYLDGGFGVGKTHLIAALWHASAGAGAYLTFAELTALIGFVGMDAAVAAFADHRLICLDEFELDDVANTLMTVTFLRRVLAAGDCGWRRRPTRCPTGWARAASTPRTSVARSPPSPSTSTWCAWTDRTSAARQTVLRETVSRRRGGPRHRRHGPGGRRRPLQ